MTDKLHELGQAKTTIDEAIRQEIQRICTAEGITSWQFTDTHITPALEKLHAESDRIDQQVKAESSGWKQKSIQKALAKDRNLTNSEVEFLINEGYIQEGPAHQFGGHGTDNDVVTSWQFTAN